jgi:hypothetical protein
MLSGRLLPLALCNSSSSNALALRHNREGVGGGVVVFYIESFVFPSSFFF